MEKLTKELLNDETVLKIYSEIDRVCPFSSSHGIRHINNTIELAEKLENLFNLSNRDRLLIETSLVLHDIGQIDGRNEHGKRSKEFAKLFLPQKNVFSEKELKTIYSAIEYHDECTNLSKLKTNISWFVNLIDKLDFSKNRLEENYKEKYKYSVYEDVDHLDFKFDNKSFQIDIKLIDGSKVKIEDLFERVLFSKAMHIYQEFCKNFGLKSQISLNGENVNLKLLNTEHLLIK